MEVVEQPATPRVPAWATQPFRRFIDESERLVRLIHLSSRGIAVIRGVPQIIEVLARVEDTESEPETQARVTQAREEALIAQNEVDQQFPLLHGLGTVGLWSLLEAAVLDFVVAWFKNQPGALQTEPVSRLRVRIGEYEQLEGDDRLSFLAALLDRETSAGLRNGVERFESLFRALHLDGPVPKRLAKDVFEFGQVRNGVVHRGGRIDRELSESCPWLELKPNEQLMVSREMFQRYASGSMSYVVLLICRVGQRFGVDMSNESKGVFEAYDAPSATGASPDDAKHTV